MSIFRDLLSAVMGMFAGDFRLSVLILAVVGLAAALTTMTTVDPLASGAVLLGGTLLGFLLIVCITARQQR